jgi:hypothetical protein
MVCGIYVGGCTPKLFLVRATMKAVKNTVEGVKFTYCKITTKIRWQLHEGFENPCSLGEDLIMTSIPAAVCYASGVTVYDVQFWGVGSYSAAADHDE